MAAIDRTGGPARWAPELGLPLPRSGRRWTPEEIAVALGPLVAGRETWPSRRELEQAGLSDLSGIASGERRGDA